MTLFKFGLLKFYLLYVDNKLRSIWEREAHLNCGFVNCIGEMFKLVSRVGVVVFALSAM